MDTISGVSLGEIRSCPLQTTLGSSREGLDSLGPFFFSARGISRKQGSSSARASARVSTRSLRDCLLAELRERFGSLGCPATQVQFLQVSVAVLLNDLHSWGIQGYVAFIEEQTSIQKRERAPGSHLSIFKEL